VPHLHALALLPAHELGCGSPSTVWRRLDEWERMGVFDRLSLSLLDQLDEDGRLDLERIGIDTTSIRALKGGSTPAQPSRPREGWQQAPPGR
jgi:hypothetical protein